MHEWDLHNERERNSTPSMGVPLVSEEKILLSSKRTFPDTSKDTGPLDHAALAS
jgi:hypothetical protein